ncbi:MAG: hypothetical protein GX455_05985, partial [Phycisphaerae bacterium]|nr:hypothetical protein [Phycisphaerae bacterium]
MVLVLLIVGWLVYEAFGDRLIRNLFQNQSLRIRGHSLLNPDKSIEYYLRLGDQVVRGCVVYLLLLISVVRVAYGWVYAPDRRPRLLLICGLMIVASTYLINPDRRMIFGHGGIHTGIVYQILNGGLPPANPLLAGQPLRYPWGYHVCVATICRVFHIAPGWSFVLINLASLGLCMILIARVCRCLIRDTAGPIYAVSVSLFMTTLISRPILEFVSKTFGYELESRALFAGQKFLRFNGDSLGILCFILSVYSLIRLVQGHHSRRYCLFFFLAVAGCGFLYPLMFPAVCASGGMVVLYLVLEAIRSRRFRWIPLIQIPGCLFLSILLVVPFLKLMTGPNVGHKIGLLDLHWIFRSGVNVVFILGPIFCIILLEFRSLRSHWNPQAAAVLMLVFLACLGCYLGMHMFNEAEYKFLILLNITVGIVGGLALSTLRTRLRPGWMFVLLLVFGSPAIFAFDPTIRPYSWSRTPLFRQHGTTLLFFDPLQDELYRWIRNSTPANAVFADTKLDIPYCGQRSLYLGWTGVENPDRLESGYNISMYDLLERQSGYPKELLDFRRHNLHQLYSPDQPISDTLLQEMRKIESLYIVLREPEVSSRFAEDDFETVFVDSSGRIRV